MTVRVSPVVPPRSVPADASLVDRSIDHLSRILGVDARDEFQLRSVQTDALGMTHVRLDRMHDGVKVLGEQVIAHFNRDGSLASTSGEVKRIPTRRAALAPPVDAQAAREIALKQFGAATDSEPTVERVYFQGADGVHREAFQVECVNMGRDEGPARQNYVVDALTGGVLQSWNAISFFLDQDESKKLDAQLQANPAVADDQSLYSGLVDVGATQQQDGRWLLLDQSRGRGIQTRDARDYNTRFRATDVFDNNNVWGESTDDPRNAAAVDAQFIAQTTYDYYRDVLGRDSIDGEGEKLTSNVHYRTQWANAMWDSMQMNYGDGDGNDSRVLTSLDIGGHEITHGLAQRTSNISWFGEAGPLGESFADVVGGAGVEWYALQKHPELAGKINPYEIGEQVAFPNQPHAAFRYMDDPSKSGSGMDNYATYLAAEKKDPHDAAGIMDNAFYLLTHGGTNKTSGREVTNPIGMEKGLKIFARALTEYTVPRATFGSTRVATIHAAEDLFGADSVEVQKVKEVWSAVGVEDPPPEEPTPSEGIA